MTRTFILALFLTAPLAPSSSAQLFPTPKPRPAAPTEPTADALQEAESLLEKQQYSQAEGKLEALTARQAKNPQFWFDLGFAQSHQGKTPEAIEAYRKAVALAPDWFEANLNLGVELARSGNSAAAEPVLKHAVELKPTSGGQRKLASAWLALADASQFSDPKSSVAAYDKAAELGEVDPELAARAAMALVRAGDVAGAEQRLKKAAAAGSPTAVRQLVVLLSGQKRYVEAAEWMKKQNLEDPKSLYQLARLLKDAGETEQAISILEKLRATPAGSETGRELASLYLDRKQYDKAANILQELAEAHPGDAELRWDLGNALLYQRKYPDAEKEMFEALKMDPQIVQKLEGDYWELAYAAQQNKHYELAIRVLDMRAQRLPETPATYWIRAVSYDSLGAVKLAAANYRLFLAADGGKSPDQEFQARHRLKAIEPQR
jgi:Flp pilus assembly protein TadD